MVTCAVDKFNRGLDYINIDIFKFSLKPPLDKPILQLKVTETPRNVLSLRRR